MSDSGIRSLSASRLGLSLRLSSQKKAPQCDGVVMNLVVSRVDERDRTLSCQGPQPVELFRMLVDLRGVAGAKFPPAGGIVAEPFPQCGAGCDVLGPLIDGGVYFLHPARP